jgi:signal transduction histidine kinase/phage shock protein PspC (stress-responsive transcriptional regulator)
MRPTPTDLPTTAPTLGPAPVDGAYQFRRAYRNPRERIVAGVAAGLADHLRLPVVAVRVAFVALLVANGLGALLYVAFWAVLRNVPEPDRTGTPPVVARTASARPDRSRPGEPRSRLTMQSLAFFALGLGILLLEIESGGFGLDATLVGLVALVAFGAGIIWHQAEPDRRRRPPRTKVDGHWLRRGEGEPERRWLRRGETDPGRWFLFRVIGGGGLVVLGIIGILGFLSPIGEGSFAATLTGLAFALLALAGVALALAPLLWRVFGQLREERVARIREQERAEVAAVVHDQVLHTLALIQRNATDPTSVLRLARGQERTLRGWLYHSTGSPAERFAAAVEEVAAEVEDTYAIRVEPVIVGDAPYDDEIAALVGATREALVNAARHADVGTVSLYAEVEPEAISVYVRDRGTGYDLSTVDDDRHGVRGSIIGRMRRHGGQAEIRTAPGEGTEVALTMPRTLREARP